MDFKLWILGHLAKYSKDDYGRVLTGITHPPYSVSMLYQAMKDEGFVPVPEMSVLIEVLKEMHRLYLLDIERLQEPISSDNDGIVRLTNTGALFYIDNAEAR